MSEELQKAIEARDEYLKDHPEMQAFQDYIDATLDKCHPDQRAEVLQMILFERVSAINEQLQKLMKEITEGIDE